MRFDIQSYESINYEMNKLINKYFNVRPGAHSTRRLLQHFGVGMLLRGVTHTLSQRRQACCLVTRPGVLRLRFDREGSA